MVARSIFALPLAALAAGAILVACVESSGTPPPGPSPTPMGPRVDRCGVGLVDEDPDRGLPTATIDPAPGELFVDALLVESASGASIEGRPLAYAGRLRGDLPLLHAATGQIVIEARHRGSDDGASASPSGATSCEGEVRLLLTSDILTRPDRMGRAVVSATLGGATVTGGLGVDTCYANRADDSVSVECSIVGVRRGRIATDGILRIRLAWSGEPGEVASLPGWAEALLAAAGSPEPGATRAPMSWTVSADRPSLVEDPTGVGGGNVRIRTEEGTIRYRLDLPVLHRPDLPDPRQREGMLYVAISGYDGPGEYTADAITGEVTLRGDGTWAEPGDRHYALTACSATLAAAIGAENRLECDLDGVPGEQQPGAVIGHLSATWSAESVPSEVGQAVEVAWRIGDHYRSEGRATVSRSSAQQAGHYDVPQVRVGGTPAAPEVLRISVMPFTGDGIYVGDAVLAMLDGVTGESPQVVVDGNRWSDAWSPVFGDCVVTIENAGASGQIECPGAASPDQFPGVSTTLYATWRVLP